MRDQRNILWLASFPKSGNTWLAAILESAGCDFGYVGGNYDAYHLQAKRKDPVVCNTVDGRVLPAPCSVLKTHAQFDPGGLPHSFPGTSPVSAGFLHIYRNPFDVLLSYIGFSRLEYASRANDETYQRRLFTDLLGFPEPIAYDDWRATSLDDIPRERLDHALDVFGRTGMVIPTLKGMCGSWIDHWRSWTRATAGLPGYSLRYEDCLADPGRFAPISDLFTFGPEHVLESVARVNRATAQRASSGSARDRIFFNKREAGYFADYFSGPAIERFAELHGEALEETGYGSLVDKARGA